jgi:quercetin dioxygenase-like cupin family protein
MKNLITMVQIFRGSESEEVMKQGYIARYIADIKFRSSFDSVGFILVTVEDGTRTIPHCHAQLEEVFIFLSDLKMYIDSKEYVLRKGDVVLVAPNESHSFEASEGSSASIIAMKFPNLKNDKISLTT